jgi:hypothetical protein
MGHIGL